MFCSQVIYEAFFGSIEGRDGALQVGSCGRGGNIRKENLYSVM